MSEMASAVMHALHAPLLLSTLTNDTSSGWSNVTADDGDTILLRDFDRQVFVEVMLMYAAPCAVAFIVSRTNSSAQLCAPTAAGCGSLDPPSRVRAACSSDCNALWL